MTPVFTTRLAEIRADSCAPCSGRESRVLLAFAREMTLVAEPRFQGDVANRGIDSRELPDCPVETKPPNVRADTFSKMVSKTARKISRVYTRRPGELRQRHLSAPLVVEHVACTE